MTSIPARWGSATSQGKDLRDVTYSNYYPVSFGGNFAIKDTSTVEQYEHVQAISVGYGATYFLAINQKDVESCSQKDQIFAAIRTWEDARHANAFPRAIKRNSCATRPMIGGWKLAQTVTVGRFIGLSMEKVWKPLT